MDRHSQIIAAAFTSICVGQACAEDPSTRLTRLVADLGSEQFAARDRASELLQQDADISLQMIERALAATPEKQALSPEQVERLTQAAATRFAQQPHAAMGVSFSWNEKTSDGVEISGTIENFESKRVLQAGDIIQSLDGVRLRDQAQTRAVIVSHLPGEEVTLRVLRQGELMTVKLVLGNYDQLQQNPGRRNNNLLNPQLGVANPLDSKTMREAWELRAARLSASANRRQSEVVDAGISARQWDQIDTALGGKQEQIESIRLAQLQRNRQAFIQQGMVQVRAQNGAVQVWRGQTPEDGGDAGASAVASSTGSQRTQFASAPAPFALAIDRSDEGVVAKRSRLYAEMRSHQLKIVQIERELQTPNLAEGTRMALAQQLMKSKMEYETASADLARLKPRGAIGQVEP